MPHQPRPFFRPARNTWFVEIRKKQHPLGKHPADAPPPKKGRDGRWKAPPEILREFHRLMSSLADEPEAAPVPAVPSGHPFVCAVLDAYLEWLEKRVQEGSKAQRTYDWYRKYLQSFLSSAGLDLTVDLLQPSHVYTWVDSQAGWKTGKRGAMVAVQRAFTWAAKAGLLKSLGGKSPLTALEKPAQGRREQLVSEEEYREALALVRDEEFRDLLELSWETGARPHELFTVEAAYVDLPSARWIFPVKESKGKKIQRVVYLTDKALEITRRLALKHPAGKLLRNTEGRPWCVSSVKCRFQQLRVALGRMRLQRQPGLVPPKIKRLTKSEREDPKRRQEHQREVLARRKQVKRLAWEHGSRYSLYSIRHSFCTFALAVGGLDAVTVSQLMGHRDTTMISRHYAHLAERSGYLRDAAKRARGA